jgi:hypothetical protein
MRRILCALAFALASPVWAQTPAPPAQELIAAASAQDIFEALPSDHQVVVRHIRSGLTCRLNNGWRSRIVIFPEAARGEDVACDSTNGHETVTLYATRYSFATNLNDQFNGAVEALHQRFPDARGYTPVAAQSYPGLPESRSAAFLVSRPNDNAQMYTQVSVAMVSGWVFVMRYSVLAPDAATAQNGETEAHALWASALSEIASDHL